MSRSEDGECEATPANRPADGRAVTDSDPYAFDESCPAFRVVVGRDRRPTGFLIRAADESEARRQLMVAAIRLGFDRTGENVELQRADAPESAD